MEILLVLRQAGCWARISWLLARLEALVLDIVPLLLHVVGNEDFGHENFLTTSNLELVIKFLLTHLSHFLARSVVQLLLLDQIVALSLLQERLLLDAETR